VVTGGYNGVMEAVSRGAKEAGGHVIGVTVDVIARNFDRVPNAFLDQEVRTAALLDPDGESLAKCLAEIDSAPAPRLAAE